MWKALWNGFDYQAAAYRELGEQLDDLYPNDGAGSYVIPFMYSVSLFGIRGVNNVTLCIFREEGETWEEALEEVHRIVHPIRGEKYPIVIQPWRTKGEHRSAYFQYPKDIRRIIYATDSIEAVHRQLRKRNKTQGWLPERRQPAETLILSTR